MKYLNITTARARDPGHSVAPHTGEQEQLPTFPFIQPPLLWTFYQPANPSPPGQGCTGGGYFGPVPVLTFVWRGSCCCCCSAYTPGIFKMQARVFCVARNNHEIGCHTALCSLCWRYLQILILTLSHRGRLPYEDYSFGLTSLQTKALRFNIQQMKKILNQFWLCVVFLFYHVLFQTSHQYCYCLHNWEFSQISTTRPDKNSYHDRLKFYF